MKYINENLNKMLKAQALETMIDYIAEYGLDEEELDEFHDAGVEICTVLANKTAYSFIELADHIYDGYKLAVRVSYPEMEGYETPVIIVDGKDVVYEDLYRYGSDHDHTVFYAPRFVYCSLMIEDYYDFITVDSKDVAIYEPYMIGITARAIDEDDYEPKKTFEKFDCDDNSDDLPF